MNAEPNQQITPQKVAIVGGAGQIARLLHPMLLEAGVTPVPLVRKESQAEELTEAGARPRFLDIENSELPDFVNAVEGCDAIVFAAGGGADGNVDRKHTVDYLGSVKAANAAKEAGITRFVQVSAISVDEPLPEDTSNVWRAYVEAKRDADTHLRDTDLEWTILRPGQLTNDAGAGKVTLAQSVEPGKISREDVAAVIAEVLLGHHGIRAQWELVAGDTPIADAVKQGSDEG